MGEHSNAGRSICSSTCALMLCLSGLAAADVQAELTEEQVNALQALGHQRPVEDWPELSAAQARALKEKAERYLADCQKYHQPFGLSADILFSGYDRAKVEKYEGIGDSATWTGHYLAALAFRYAVTADTNTIADIRRALDAYEVLARVTGLAGYMARFAGPADDPAYQRYYSVYGKGADPNRPGYGTSAYPGKGKYTNLVWLGNSSRDVYIGVNLGLATVHRLVPDAKIRAQVKGLVELILRQLMGEGWLIKDGQGHTTVCTPTLIATLLRTGATVNPRRYQSLYDEKARPVLIGSGGGICKYCDYFPNNLLYAMIYVLATLEADPAKKPYYEAHLRRMWLQSSDHLNPYFAALYLSAGGEDVDGAARATVQGVLSDFPSPPRWSEKTENSRRRELELVQMGGKQWAKYALPIRERVPSDFIWQRSPFQLDGSGDAPLAYPGIDLVLPYWMGRQCGVIPTGEETTGAKP
ncbi:MAG: hypothetical protein AAB676_11035 [Verrucomicrobiota bacterium]